MDPPSGNPSTVTTEAPISNDEPSETPEDEDFYDYENDYEDPGDASVSSPESTVEDSQMGEDPYP